MRARDGRHLGMERRAELIEAAEAMRAAANELAALADAGKERSRAELAAIASGLGMRP